MNTTFWFLNNYYVLGSALCILAQLILLILLLAQRHQEKRDIRALRASERMYRSLAENAEDVIARLAPDGRILYISPACQDVFGYAPDEVLEQGAAPFIHPEDLEHTWDTVHKVEAAGTEHYCVQNRIQHKQGHWIWAEIRGRLLYDNSGKCAEIYCLIRDSTECKQIEDALRANEEKFRAFFGLMPVGISVSTLQEGRFLEVNEAFLRAFGCRRDEIIGKTSLELNMWTVPAERSQFLKPLRQHGIVRNLELAIRIKSENILNTLFSCETVEIDGQQCLISAFMDITERKRNEEALLESEAKFRAIFENAPVTMAISREDGRYLDVNQKFVESTGFSKEDILGKKPSDGLIDMLEEPSSNPLTLSEHAPAPQKSGYYLDPSDFEYIEQKYRTHGRLENFYFRSITWDRQVVHNLMSIYPLSLQGEACALTIVTDITGLKEAENDLLEREEKYHVLFENMAQGAIYRMADGQIDEVNSAALEILGVSYDELMYASSALNTPRWKVIHEDGSDCPIDEWPATVALTTGKPVRNVTVGVYDPRKQGYTWLTIAAIPEFSPGEHQPYRVFTTFHDVTELKRVEQELRTHQEQLEELVEERTLELQREIEARKESERSLRESEEKYRLIAENATDVIACQNSAGEFTYLSPSIQQLLGYSPEEIMQGRHGPLLTPEAQEIAAKARAQKRADDPSPTRLELEHIRQDGSTVWVEVILKRLYDAMGQHTGFLGISRDVSERKQTEHALKQAKDNAVSANRAKSVFLSNMSHELRTPLNAILGFAQLLSLETMLSTTQQEYIDTINRSGEHLLQLINDVLDMSKIEAERVSVTPSSFDLLHMLNNVEEMIQVRAQQKDLEFSIEYPANMPRYIISDEKKLRQILINILGNAIKFTEQGRVTLRVNARSSGEPENLSAEKGVLVPDSPIFQNSETPMLQFEISDTGPGITPEEFSTIFEAFHQTPSRGDHEGTGLGLAISRQFAQLLGGDIQVESELGRGSRFRVDIQVDLPGHDSMMPGKSMRTIVGLASPQRLIRILVVDDHAESCRLIHQLLEQVGFEVTEASNGREALTLLEKWSPDLILMDMRMPVMDGYETTLAIRERENTGLVKSPIPIIAMTASVFKEEQEKVLAAGCDKLLRKPISVPELFEEIRSSLGLEYVYVSEKHAQNILRQRDKGSTLTPDALAALPDALLETLKQAVISGSQALMTEAIGAVREHDPELADSITTLVHGFKYHALWKMIQQSTSAAGSGE